MRCMLAVLTLSAAVSSALAAQQLREVPQRFMYIQPVGLAFGIGTAGYEHAVGRRTSAELTGMGVYTEEDGVRVYGGGLGLGVRRYAGSGEMAGFMLGGRIDWVWLVGENAIERRGRPYLGLGIFGGYRWVSTSGFLLEPIIGYEGLIGPRPLVFGSRHAQDNLGVIAGIGVGWGW